MLGSTQHAWPLDESELKPALELIVALAHADMAVLMLHDDDNDQLVPVMAHGLTPNQLERIGAYRSAEGPLAVIPDRRTRVRLRDVTTEPTVFREIAREAGLRHAELLPFFRRDGGVLGAFALIHRNRRRTRRQSEVLEQYCADVIASALFHANEHVRSERARALTTSGDSEKMQFVARFSHELRTPLQSILGYVDLIRSGMAGPSTSEQLRMLDRISEGTRVIVTVINDLITFARLEVGQVAYNIISFSPATCIRSAEAIVTPLAQEHGIALDVVDCGPDVRVRADPDKLKQILVNLMANGVKFTPTGGRVTVRCRAEADDIIIDVADNGFGIPDDKLPEIFGPYVQLEAPKARHLGGSGLGLAISREFALGMAGDLTAASHLGHGSVFSLRLPRASSPRRAWLVRRNRPGRALS